MQTGDVGAMREEQKQLQMVEQEIRRVVVGKDAVIHRILTAILAGGHILIEDVPGVGKTTLALAFSRAMELSYKRLQFTPDVMPSDVVGYSVYNKATNRQVYVEGGIMCNLFLADEINRTSSKTQSALLEVMEEGSVTVDGVTRAVPKPFIVMATQNPVGSAGTQMLPESQLDRFMIRTSMGYPEPAAEVTLMRDRGAGNPLDAVVKVMDCEALSRLMRQVEDVYVHDAIYSYIARLSAATRSHESLALGLSPRGSLALAGMAKANALQEGRDYVLPADVQEIFSCVAAHRMVLTPMARVNHLRTEKLAEDILMQVPAPKLVEKKGVK